MKALIYIVWCVASALGVTYDVIKVEEGDDLRCNSSAVISCKFPVTVSTIFWKIAPDVKNSSITAATCFLQSCTPHNLFLTNYLFTFDQLSGVSNVTIKKVTFEHNNLEFRCDDGTTPDPIKRNVTEPPTIETSIMKNTTDELGIETSCVYPTDNIDIKWYSKTINGKDRQQHTPSSSGRQLCNTTSECILANKSAHITSALKLSTLTSINASSQRSFEVEIIYGSGNYTFFVGNFFVPVASADNCKPETSESVACWKYGVAFVCSVIMSFVIFAVISVLYKYKVLRNIICQKDVIYKGALFGIGTILLQLVIVTIAARFSQQSKEDCIDQFPCWAIFLIILSIVVILLVVCLVFIILEPVHDVNVFDRTVQGGQMVVKLNWKARCFHLKKFYAEFKSEINQSFIREMNYTALYDGSLECVIGGLSLDNDYQAHIHSRICCIRSLWKTIVFDTKGRPLPPQSVCEKELQRTMSSVTLTWIPAKGHTDHFYIKYKRQKGKKNGWKVTQIITNNYFTVDKLNSGTTYTFKVFAVNSIGHSDESSPLSIRTNAIELLPPDNFNPIEVNANDVTLSWNPSNTLKKQSFLLNYYTMADNRTVSKMHSHEINIPYDGKATMIYHVKGLEAGTKYSLKMLTCIGKRKSEYSKVIEIQTKE